MPEIKTSVLLELFPHVCYINLKDWHKRGLLPAGVIRGRERHYTFQEMVFVLVFAHLAQVMAPAICRLAITDITESVIAELESGRFISSNNWLINPITGIHWIVVGTADRYLDRPAWDPTFHLRPALMAKDIAAKLLTDKAKAA